MTAYYVDGTNGSSGNDGLAVGTAKATLSQVEALGLAPGDIVHIAPGRYNETLTITDSGSLAGGQIEWRGDPYGLVFGREGIVRMTGKTTDATTGFGTLNNAILLTTLTNTTYVKFSNIVIDNYAQYLIVNDGAGNRNMEGMEWENCVFVHNPRISIYTIFICDLNVAPALGAGGTGARWINCAFVCLQNINTIRLDRENNTSASNDIEWEFQNCQSWSRGGSFIAATTVSSGGSGFSDYGITLRNCALYHHDLILRAYYVKLDGLTFCEVYDCLIASSNSITYGDLGSSFTSGALLVLERRNLLVAVGDTTPWDTPSDLDATNTVAERAWIPGFALDSYFQRGYGLSPFAGYPFNAAQLNDYLDSPERLATGTTLAEDAYGNPRVTAGIPRAGAVESPRQPTRETTTTPSGEDDALNFRGAGWSDAFIEVDAASTTISVESRKDSNYTGDEPILEVLNIPGVADQTDALSVAADTWETLSVTFTPTVAGICRVRRRSRDSSATGKCYFGQVEVS